MMLEFNDIQSGVLRPRPTPYAATYILLRIDDRAAGHQLLKQLTPKIASATDLSSPAGDAWLRGGTFLSRAFGVRRSPGVA